MLFFAALIQLILFIRVTNCAGNMYSLIMKIIKSGVSSLCSATTRSTIFLRHNLCELFSNCKNVEEFNNIKSFFPTGETSLCANHTVVE